MTAGIIALIRRLASAVGAPTTSHNTVRPLNLAICRNGDSNPVLQRRRFPVHDHLGTADTESGGSSVTQLRTQLLSTA